MIRTMITRGGQLVWIALDDVSEGFDKPLWRVTSFLCISLWPLHPSSEHTCLALCWRNLMCMRDGCALDFSSLVLGMVGEACVQCASEVPALSESGWSLQRCNAHVRPSHICKTGWCTGHRTRWCEPWWHPWLRWKRTEKHGFWCLSFSPRTREIWYSGTTLNKCLA